MEAPAIQASFHVEDSASPYFEVHLPSRDTMRPDHVVQRLRRLCLSLPEASEVASWSHPNFRAGKRTFVAFEVIAGRPSIAFRLNPTDVDLLLRRKQFFPTPYGQGKWVSLWADTTVNWRLVEKLVHQSYRLVALKRMLLALDGTKPIAE